MTLTRCLIGCRDNSAHGRGDPGTGFARASSSASGATAWVAVSRIGAAFSIALTSRAADGFQLARVVVTLGRLHGRFSVPWAGAWTGRTS
jgi:hypothetical protein